MRHPRRNEVFRDVGSEEHAPDDADFIEVQRIPFDPDSALLLCSDGLSDQVPSAQIRATVERHAGDPEAAVRGADRRPRISAGGKDNVTVVIVEGEQFTAPRPRRTPSRLEAGAAGGCFRCGSSGCCSLAGDFAGRAECAGATASAEAVAGILIAGGGAAYASIMAAVTARATGRHGGCDAGRVSRAGGAEVRRDMCGAGRRVGRFCAPGGGAGTGDRGEKARRVRAVERLFDPGGCADAAFGRNRA